jgi:hypothetical protein
MQFKMQICQQSTLMDSILIGNVGCADSALTNTYLRQKIHRFQLCNRMFTVNSSPGTLELLYV